jgi:hypothetical protein
LRSPELDADVLGGPDQGNVLPSIKPPDGSSTAGNLPLVVEVKSAVVGECAGRQVDAGSDFHVDRPGPKDITGLEHEVPVDTLPTVFQDDEPAGHWDPP